MLEQYIIDTYAWIEYFKGSVRGKKAKPIIENSISITPTIVLAEIKKKFVDWRRMDFEEKLNFIRSRSTIVPLDESNAILAGEIRATSNIQGIGIVDCILLALSKNLGAKVVSGDPHFKGLPEVEFIGE